MRLSGEERRWFRIAWPIFDHQRAHMSDEDAFAVAIAQLYRRRDHPSGVEWPGGSWSNRNRTVEPPDRSGSA